MSFSIEFLTDDQMSEAVIHGQITVGEFSETFEVSSSFWEKKDYLNQWKEGLYHLVSKKERSCLITSMYDPALANFITIWPLYIEGSTVFVRNNLLFLKSIREEFSVDNVYIHIPRRQTVNEEGVKISEWATNLENVKAFLAQMQSR